MRHKTGYFHCESVYFYFGKNTGSIHVFAGNCFVSQLNKRAMCFSCVALFVRATHFFERSN